MTKKIKPRKRGANPDNLTFQQNMFIEAYFTVSKFKAADAARRAGYTSPASAVQLLNNPKVKAIMGKRMNDLLNEYHSDADRIVLELENIAFANPQDILRPDGSVTPLQEMPQRVARSISRMKVSYVDGGFDANGNPVTATNVDISYYNKLEALAMLMNYRGMNAPVELNVKAEVDWDAMVMPHANPQAALEEAIDTDPIEKRILALEMSEDVTDEEET